MNKNLVVLIPYKGFESILYEIFEEINFHPIVIEGQDLTDKLINELNQLYTNGLYPDVIISRGAIASHISKMFKNTVVVKVEPDYMDIIIAINNAKIHGDKIGIIMLPETILLLKNKINIIKDIMNLKELKLYPFETYAEQGKQVICGKLDQMDVMIGGTAAVDSGLENNMQVEFLGTSKISAVNAINQALSIIDARKKERNQLKNLNLVINCMKEGFMIIKDNRVVLSNSKLKQILCMEPSQIFKNQTNDVNNCITSFINGDIDSKGIVKIGKMNYLMEKLNIENNDFADKIISFHDVTKIQNQEQKIRSELHAKGFVAKYNFNNIVANNKKMKEIINNSIMYATTDANILIFGNSGTGKELFAQSIHNKSNRKNNPFVPINCGAIPENLFESELFGYVEGAFSGAKKGGKIGLLELAHKGTIFLDEVNSLPISLQGKLLRVIQEKELRRIGSESVIAIDIRIISAMNQDVHELIENKKFRVDLYYRLNTLNITLPDLCERKDDILTLANHFIMLYSKKYEINIPYLNNEESKILCEQKWPGNIRELANTIHRYVVLYKKNQSSGLLLNCIESTNCESNNQIINIRNDNSDIIKIHRDKLAAMEKEIILTYLNENKWNRQIVADKLGLCRTTLWRKLKEIEQNELFYETL
ncbi:MAG: sigma 54-interacting transcriptional regulator [Clostridiaceae bacterium]|nr:sigma 54-interacting transcriptional regulator [Clostridiaceae bacterium]